jgi:hypothetical protein
VTSEVLCIYLHFFAGGLELCATSVLRISPFWNAAIQLAVAVFALTSQPQFKSQYSLRDQLERAAVSVSNNIAEGF